ncbi:hypothetical protein A3B87_03095 [Candidatus Kuenenbacteria bacterium RIFCSPHIGHO2_02_FULL_39_13]|uniref:Uncharacterized protein n=1 Tax=Candidatus Kuenenbacteria bacterium RIFCSPHIGHO2_02_FULL_39_13 TaxID=1798561 RepID=A0A1F6FMV1_9BACT|nr:MAG: hypothetical protein A3B87_03095 [Candidatus Kuenenbacteria bacterium RIFCSPHIGHO2_02_FULL_39_13]
MRKLKYILLIVALSVFMLPGYVMAANDVTVEDDTTISLTSPSMNLTLESSSTYSSMTVETGSVAFTVSAGGSITLTSGDRYTLSNDQSAEVLCSSGSSQVIFSVASGLGDKTITFTPNATLCDAVNKPTSNPGSGTTASPGGGGTPPPATPAAETPADESTGTGEITSNIGAGAAGNLGAVTTKGINALMGNGATGSFTLSTATGGAAGSHSIQVQNITGNQATITVSSEALVFTLMAGKSKNVDIDGDGYRDMKITLNRIVDSKADVTAKEIKVVKIDGTAPGSLVKIKSKTAVYYLGEDSQRYVFPNEKVYYSWYNDFSGVKTITDEDMAKLPIGGLVTYRPGTRMVIFATTVDVYAVTQGGVLRKLKDEAMAAELYGVNWNKHIDDVNDAFYSSYAFSSDLTSSAEYNQETEKTFSPTITADKSI